MSEKGGIEREATLAGAGSGTVIASIISLVPDSGAKSLLLILAPTMAVLITAAWGHISDYIDDKLADYKVSRERKRAEKLVEDMERSATADDATLLEMRNKLEALKLLEIQLSQRRIEAVLADDGSGSA